jgi:quercetin dioxygenase-like cupin family protein
MTRFAAFAAATIVGLLPLAAHAQAGTIVTSPAAVQWKQGPPALPKGTQVAVLFGDPTKPGPFGTRTKFPAGTKIMPHTHPVDENVTVISGSVHIGYGDKFDPTKAILVKAGGFIHNPAGTAHYAWFTQPTVVQNITVGPFGMTYVNAANNPPKGK